LFFVDVNTVLRDVVRRWFRSV